MNGHRNPQWSRRQFLGMAGMVAGGLALPPPVWLPSVARTAGPTGFAAGRALRAAMHLHGSWSEGLGSWDAQFGQAAANGFDLLYLTDHDHRALALGYLTSLTGLTLSSSSTGSFARKVATAGSGSFRLLAESTSTTQAASVTLAVKDADAAGRLRTSIAGFTIRHTVTSALLGNGARYEVVVPLSYHPATGGRAAGQYRLVYRFGAAQGRSTESGGLTGIIGMPTPAAGSVQTLSPETDAAALWPDMLAIDNVVHGLSFVARSPRRTAVADVAVRSVTFTRTQATPAAVIDNQARVVGTYRTRYPGLAAYASTEISNGSPHLNQFGMPAWLPDYSSLPADHDTRYRQIVAEVHGRGGLVSWNHPFGSDSGPLLSTTAQADKRRKVFASMQAVELFGVDVLEVAFASRGQVDAATHLALWDTFSRAGRFLTGNGTSDDHSGKSWRTLTNGFATGLWAGSPTDAAVASALAAGRAFAAHAGRWPGGEIDMLVDGVVPMGAVSVSTVPSRRLAISAANLPAGSSIQVVSGPVDYGTQPDPGTSVVTTLPASAFGAGPCTVQVDTSSSRFYRAQPVAADGGILGTGNPVWLLRQPPPGGVPPARAA